MIKLENIDTYGWESAIRGMRNPMNSWNKSDSEFEVNCVTCNNPLYPDCESCSVADYSDKSLIGPNDLELMKKLAAAGTDHRKFLRMINVTMDITAPLYWWKEFDTYKVGTVRNSCSTMHKIHAKEFTLDDFSHEHLMDIGVYNNPISVIGLVISCLNECRAMFLETNDKQYWHQIIQLLPSSYNQRATVQLNYEVLANMYKSRKNHKLDEWREFCKEIEKLPYFMEVVVADKP